MLTIEDVSVAYAERDVLRQLDLQMPEGQLLCVLGPSGGGKSTLLRAIAGLEPARSGSIWLDGRDLAGVPPHQRDVGLMFQDYVLFPHRDVGENVAFGLRMHGQSTSTARGRVAELLELVGLPGAERRAVSQLSGGEQQRVALARALAPRPRLLMLDEPMGSLDRALRERLPDELRAIFKELGLGVIYVTHDQDEALSVADRVVLLDEGRLVADGTPEQLWTRPPSEWAARFLGFRNVASGSVLEDGLSTPWGLLPASAVDPGSDRAEGEVAVVLRASSLTADPAGPIHGRVVARRFRGDHVLLLVEVAAAPTLHVEARGGDLPAVGEEIGLSVPPGGAYVIRVAAALPSGT